MPDEDALEGQENEELPLEQDEDTSDDSPVTALEARMVALEAAQRQSVLEIRSAVGRVQSIAAKLDKTNDPQIEAKLRSELAGVSDLLGLVTDSIDETILPRDIKQRVKTAQDTIRNTAADAEINRRIAEAVGAREVPQTSDADALEAAVVAQIRSLGLNDQDPSFNWSQAASILRTQGEQAMWTYFGEVEKTLLEVEAGPQRRARTAPRAAAPSTAKDGVERFLDKETSLDQKLADMRAQGILG